MMNPQEEDATRPDSPLPALPQQHLLPADATLRTVLAHLNAVDPKLCIVVDDDGAALRTCSDGDIRRGLLGGATLESSLVDLPGRAPVLAGAGTSDVDLLALMAQKQVSTIVLTDRHQRPVALKSITDLQDHILLSPPHMGITEADYVRQAFDSNWIAPAGPNLDAFEARLAEISTRNHAIAVSSGTAGLHLALRALNLREGPRSMSRTRPPSPRSSLSYTNACNPC